MKKTNKNLFSATPGVVKKGTAAMLCVILSGLFLVAGCKKDDKKEDSYPKDIPFTEYSLTETCQWENLAYDDKVIIINSDEQLNRYLSCTGSGYPEIDFAKQTLLLANGSASSGVSKTTVNYLQQLSELEYELDMELLLDDSTAIEQKWAVALIVEKVSEGSVVELMVAEYPIDIPFEEYFIYWDTSPVPCLECPDSAITKFSCWKDIFRYDTIIFPPEIVVGKNIFIINSNEELENHLICPDDYPTIDFSKHSLLLASGEKIENFCGFLDIVFLKNAANQYTLKVAINDAFAIPSYYWCIAILTPKIENEATILLDIEQIFYY